MNLRNIASYVILIWLPVVNLQSGNKNKSIDRFQNEKNTEAHFLGVKSKKKYFLENIEEKTKENSAMARLDKSFLKLGERASQNFIKKTSANLELKSINIIKAISEKEKSAQKLTGSVKKDLSALNKYNKNKSAAIVKSKKTKKLKLQDKRKIFLAKIIKREIIKDASMDEDANSLDDYEEDELDESDEGNSTEMGRYLGAPCELKCSEKLLHVYCDPQNRVCECEEKYPVQIGAGRGCEKPKQLGDQCFYAQTCSFFDPNAICTQINHNAICQCKPGFHTVALRKGVKRMFCSEDIAVVSADLPTLLGVATGIAVLTGLICFVLRLFSGNRYPNTRHYGNANIAPPLLLSSDNQWVTGIPLTVHGRPSSRSSCQRSTMSLAQNPRNKGVLVPASRAGAARAAAILLIPCHLQASRQSGKVKTRNNDEAEVQTNEVEQPSSLGSRRQSFSSVQSTTSSQKSMTYSAKRFEQENQQREHRAAMKAAREEATKMAEPPTPSPMSADELLLASQNPEEDPLCSASVESAPQSEPPALSMNKTTTPTVPVKISPTQ